MKEVNKENFFELANIRQSPAISFYLPTHRAGQEVKEGMDAILLKNQITKLKGQLAQRAYSPDAIKFLLEPVQALVEDSTFWHQQSDGLAIFLAKDFLRTYSLPYQPAPISHISNEFYLLPLIPSLKEDRRFFLLVPKVDEVHLYKFAKGQLKEIDIEGVIPTQLEERVGSDYEAKSLQFRSHHSAFGLATFHGKGEGKDDRKEEIKRYFQTINKGVVKLLANEKAPLVFAGVHYLFAIYKSVNTFPNLFETQLSADPAKESLAEIQQKALKVLQPYFAREFMEKKASLDDFYGTGKASSDLNKIIPAALNGKVETLFVKTGAEVWGVYVPATDSIDIHEQQRISSVHLLNLAAIEVINKGGKVYLTDQEEVLPDPIAPVHAIYRY